MAYHELFKCMGDSQKLRILNLLVEGPLCVCHIHELLEESQPKVSRHLIAMKDAGWLVSSRRLNWFIYSIADESNPLIQKLIPLIKELREQDPVYKIDLGRREVILAQTASDKKECPLTPTGKIREENTIRV